MISSVASTCSLAMSDLRASGALPPPTRITCDSPSSRPNILNTSSRASIHVMTAILAVGGGPGFFFIALAGASGEMEYLSLQWEAYRWAVVILENCRGRQWWRVRSFVGCTSLEEISEQWSLDIKIVTESLQVTRPASRGGQQS